MRPLPTAVLALLAIPLLLAGGCGLWGRPAREPSSSLPAAEELPQTYTDSRYGFFITRPEGWALERAEAAEGEVLALTSPDGAVSIRVIRDFPPPTIDLPGYVRAMLDNMRLSLPGLQQVTDEAIPQHLGSGISIHRARFVVPDAIPLAGELLVAVRQRDGYQEAFLVQASGSQSTYEAWTPSVRLALDSFYLAVVAGPAEGSR